MVRMVNRPELVRSGEQESGLRTDIGTEAGPTITVV